MKITHAYQVVKSVMKDIENIDIYDTYQKKSNQEKLNKVYSKLQRFQVELIREEGKRRKNQCQILSCPKN